MKEDFINGDLGFDPLGLKPKTPEAFKSIQTKEINNGTYPSSLSASNFPHGDVLTLTTPNPSPPSFALLPLQKAALP